MYLASASQKDNLFDIIAEHLNISSLEEVQLQAQLQGLQNVVKMMLQLPVVIGLSLLM